MTEIIDPIKKLELEKERLKDHREKVVLCNTFKEITKNLEKERRMNLIRYGVTIFIPDDVGLASGKTVETTCNPNEDYPINDFFCDAISDFDFPSTKDEINERIIEVSLKLDKLYRKKG